MTDATRLATRQHFHDIDMECIAEAESGAMYVNEIAEYRAWLKEHAPSEARGGSGKG